MRQVPRLRPWISRSGKHRKRCWKSWGYSLFSDKIIQNALVWVRLIWWNLFAPFIYKIIYLWVEYLWGGWYWVITVCMIPGMNMKTSGLSWYLQSWGFVNLLYYRGFDKRGFLMFLPVENPPSKWLDPILNRCFWVNDLWYLGEGLLQDNWLVVSWFLMKKNGNDDGQKWPLYTLRDDLKPCINQTIAHYQVPKIGLSGTVKIRTRNV